MPEWSRWAIAVVIGAFDGGAFADHGRTAARERGSAISTSPDPTSRYSLPLVEILESAPDAVIGVDADGAIAFANRQVEALFGYPPDDLIGQPVEMLLPERFREPHRRHRADYLADPRTRPMGAGLELAGLRRDGSEFPVDISLSAVQADGNLITTAFVRDVTDRKNTEAMFRGLLDAAPDAVVVIDERGVIVRVNRQVNALFGYTAEELVGRPVEMLVPQRFRDVHPSHRAAYTAEPRYRAMGAGNELMARRKDGSEFAVDIALAPFETDEGMLVSAAVRDVTERLQAQHDAQQLREAQIRRRQALEINDSVVQGVATALYALERHDTDYALDALATTLESARIMMDGLLEDAGDAAPRAPGMLVREHPARVLADAAPGAEASAAHDHPGDAIRVVVADDTADMRLVLRLALTEDEGFAVVGEAADGRAAVDQAREHQPDVIVLDLAMPVMDGLEAIPLIREVSPGSKVVVLSGYGSEEMLDAALEAGADAYVVKGRPTDSLCTLLRDLCPGKGSIGGRRRPRLYEPDADLDADRQAAQDLALAVTAHELATPITVLQGMLRTLQDRMDALPSSVVQELLGAMSRHVRHMSELLAVLNDARHVSRNALQIERIPLDLPTLVQEVLRDLAPLTDGRKVHFEAPSRVKVLGDPVRLRQVVTNVVTNAVKFSSAGSPVTVAITPLAGTVQLAVTDHGPGIPADRRPQLFTKFGRLGADTSGMGLGLYISRGIMRAHGGELRLARSGPDGSTFAFELPVTITDDAWTAG